MSVCTLLTESENHRSRRLNVCVPTMNQIRRSSKSPFDCLCSHHEPNPNITEIRKSPKSPFERYPKIIEVALWMSVCRPLTKSNITEVAFWMSLCPPLIKSENHRSLVFNVCLPTISKIPTSPNSLFECLCAHHYPNLNIIEVAFWMSVCRPLTKSDH